MQITLEQIYKIEHDLISECGNIWECDNRDDATRLAFYEQGIHDMAVAIIEKISEVSGNNG